MIDRVDLDRNVKSTGLTKVELIRLETFFNFNHNKDGLVRLIAPLVDVDMRTLNKRNIPEVCISKTGSSVYLKFNTLNSKNDLSDNPNYKFSILDLEARVLEVPDIHKDSMEKIISGNLTKISAKEKIHIAEYSGLSFNRKSMLYSNTSPILLTLSSNGVLRSVLAKFLSVNTRDLPVELVTSIKPDSMVFIENYLKQIKNEL